MRASEPGETATRLPWLAPGTASLVALARADSPSVWATVRSDPGAVLLLLRHAPAGGHPSLPASLFRDPAVLQTAQQHLGHGVVDWSHPDVNPVHRTAIAWARLAESLARRVGGCDPECAWAAGLLAPLGWLAVSAVEPEAAADCWREPVYSEEFARIQRDHWRLDAAAIARRLIRRWRLPDWIRAASGHLELPVELARELGADERLFQIVQLAVLLGRSQGHDLGFSVGSDEETLTASLGLSDDDVATILRAEQEYVAPVAPVHHADLLPELLAIAIEKRRLDDGPFGERLEAEVDRLQESLVAQRASESERLHRSKLRALAELAAGAGHEINNPLAVISGHAQYLLNREADPSRQASLQAMIRQTERIHQILTELMQFARPPQACWQELDLRTIVDQAVAKHRAQADAADVRLEWHAPGGVLTAVVDGAMVQTALGALIRNAIEATPKEGWVRVTIERDEVEWLIAVEDSGPGLANGRHEHLFDPFFSGRQAGRGRGLGLSTAWRLAGQNGGDVRFDSLPGEPTRFVLALPVCAGGKAPTEPPSDMLRLTA